MEHHAANPLVVDALQSHRWMDHVDGQLLPGPGVVGWNGLPLEDGESGMPEAVQDLDRCCGDLIQLQELTEQFVAEEQPQLLGIGRCPRRAPAGWRGRRS